MNHESFAAFTFLCPACWRMLDEDLRMSPEDYIETWHEDERPRLRAERKSHLAARARFDGAIDHFLEALRDEVILPPVASMAMLLSRIGRALGRKGMKCEAPDSLGRPCGKRAVWLVDGKKLCNDCVQDFPYDQMKKRPLVRPT